MNIFTRLANAFNFYPQKRIIFGNGNIVEWINRESIRITLDQSSVTINFMFDWKSNNSRARTFNKNELVHWDPPMDSKAISAKDRDFIINLIKKYCGKKKIALSIK